MNQRQEAKDTKHTNTRRTQQRIIDSGFPTVVWHLYLGLGLAVTPPILAAVSGACVLERVWLLIANPGWGLWRVRLGLGFAFTTPILARLLGCVCLCARSASTPPILAVVCGACVGARALPLPRQPWLEFVLSVFVFGFRFWLHPANSGWGDLVCVFVCAFRLYPANPGWSACTPSIQAWVCCAHVCVSALVFALPRESWLGFVVCVSGLRACFHPANGWRVCVCVGVLRLYPTIPGWRFGVFGACVRLQVSASAGTPACSCPGLF